MGAANDQMVHLSGREVGYREGPRNNETKYGHEYGFNFVAWCAIFLSILAKWAGVKYLGKTPRFASTVAWRDHARKNGRWSGSPRVGAIAMRAHTNTTGHVGIVVGVNRNGTIYTREGNTNAQGAREGNGVWNRARQGYWHGYIILDDDNGSSPPPWEPPAEGQLAVDGGFGPKTVYALKKSLNATGANPQLDDNADWNLPTWKALQARLNHVAGPVEIDGAIGPQTIKALQWWVGVDRDGVWGAETVKGIQRKLNSGTF